MPDRSEAGTQASPMDGDSSGTSSSLLDRARGRDEAAWERLVALYSPLVAWWCRRCGLGADDANDIRQEVFAAVARGLDDFCRDDGGTFRGWLWVIARNKIRDHFRRLANEPQGAGGSSARVRLEEAPDWMEEDADPDDEGRTELFARALALIRGEFEAKTWEAFWQAAVEQRPASDIAADLQMTPGAVRQAKYRVLRRFRQELGDFVPPPAPAA